MKGMLRLTSQALYLFLLVLLAMPACTTEDPAKEALRRVVLRLETKYKRDQLRNEIDLHFQSTGPDRILIVLTYLNPSSRPLAESIGDAAIDLVKRAVREDAVLRNREIRIEKSVSLREPPKASES